MSSGGFSQHCFEGEEAAGSRAFLLPILCINPAPSPGSQLRKEPQEEKPIQRPAGKSLAGDFSMWRVLLEQPVEGINPWMLSVENGSTSPVRTSLGWGQPGGSARLLLAQHGASSTGLAAGRESCARAGTIHHCESCQRKAGHRWEQLQAGRALCPAAVASPGTQEGSRLLHPLFIPFLNFLEFPQPGGMAVEGMQLPHGEMMLLEREGETEAEKCRPPDLYDWRAGVLTMAGPTHKGAAHRKKLFQVFFSFVSYF